MTLEPEDDSVGNSTGVAPLCPNCQIDLLQVSSGRGQLFGCTGCRGRSVSVYVLKQLLGGPTVRTIWGAAKSTEEQLGKVCPACPEAMTSVSVESPQGPQQIDVCTRCQLIWFNADQMESFPPVPKHQNRTEALPAQAREAIGLVHLQMHDQRQRTQEGHATNMRAVRIVLLVLRNMLQFF